MEERKSKILSEIDRDREELEELSRKIHDDPELGFEEFHALGYISDVLKKHGYRVEQGYGGLETSFRAEKEGSKPGPTVAFLAEYDALKGVGHGCGHNLIATCSTGAFLGLASVMEDLPGKVCIIGTPASLWILLISIVLFFAIHAE